jgi:hypothetical protein
LRKEFLASSRKAIRVGRSFATNSKGRSSEIRYKRARWMDIARLMTPIRDEVKLNVSIPDGWL